MNYFTDTSETDAKKAVKAYKLSLLNQCSYDELVVLAIENEVKFNKTNTSEELIDKIAAKKFRGLA